MKQIHIFGTGSASHQQARCSLNVFLVATDADQHSPAHSRLRTENDTVASVESDHAPVESDAALVPQR